MEVKENKKNKFKISKGQLAVKIIAGILAGLMVLSVCISCIYYIISYFSA